MEIKNRDQEEKRYSILILTNRKRKRDSVKYSNNVSSGNRDGSLSGC
jgi:hypothetical protein